jgi:hypothetical protein
MTTRARALDEIAQAHAAVGGTKRGRRYATQQINQAYAVLLASQFQGFCCDLYAECVDHLMVALSPPLALRPIVHKGFTRGCLLDRGNAQPASLGTDFERLGINLWREVESFHPRNKARKADLGRLNEWRNAIAHQNFDPAKLGGATTLRLTQVQRWRVALQHLARAFDRVTRMHLQTTTGSWPW